MYRVLVGICLSETLLNRTTCFQYTGAGPSLIHENYLNLQCKCHLKRLESQKLRTVTKEAKNMNGIIPLFVSIGALQVQISLEVVQDLATNVLLGTKKIYKCI